MRGILLASLTISAATVVACGGASSSPTPTSSMTGVQPSPEASAVQPTTAPGEPPAPQHLTFAPGETITADGKAGVFFLNPYTGAADGWVVPAANANGIGPQPFSFSLGGVSSDGARVVYQCLEYTSSEGPVPCGGGSDHLWYLLDTTSGARIRLTTFTGTFAAISPDGRTLLGVTRDGLAVSNASDPPATRQVVMPVGSDPPAFADWSPDSANVIIRTAVGGQRPLAGAGVTGTFLVRVDDLRVVPLNVESPAIDWSSDGSRVALASRGSSRGSLVVLDRDGKLVWSRQVEAPIPNPRWSPDGSMLSLQVRYSNGQDNIDRVDVFDSEAGTAKYRIPAASACEDPIWTGTMPRLLVHTYYSTSGSFPSSLIDLSSLSITTLGGSPTALPFDGEHGVEFDGSAFSLVVLGTGARTRTVMTTVSPTWDGFHEGQPRFVDDRIFFTPLHAGHGYCGEGGLAGAPPKLEILQPPFADDGPATRAP